MYLSRHEILQQPRWALDGRLLPADFKLGEMLQIPQATLAPFLQGLPSGEPATGRLLAPIEATQEVWAAGVTYRRSREAREAESEIRDVYEKVYSAERPELFFKASGWRTVGHRSPIRIRRDATWHVPEPELTLVANSRGEIVGFCVGDDVSSRDIEGANPLYLPQAKVFNGSCALGPGIEIANADDLTDLPIAAEIERNGITVFEGMTRTSQIKRSFPELVGFLRRELDFPNGVFLMTGTGIVPPDDFTLQPGDVVRITVASLTLENEVRV